MTPPTQSQEPSSPREAARGFALILTNSAKVLGLIGGANELLLRPELRPVAVAFCAFLIAGGIGLESFLRAFFAVSAAPPPQEPSGP